MQKKPISIAVLNHKGGVGKTATVSGLASGLKQINPNYKILIIDADEQANIKTIFLNLQNWMKKIRNFILKVSVHLM